MFHRCRIARRNRSVNALPAKPDWRLGYRGDHFLDSGDERTGVGSPRDLTIEVYVSGTLC